MAKAKFSLSATPTFKAKVSIAVPGGKSADIEFTFKHRTRDEFKEFFDGLKDVADGDDADVNAIMDIASGWDLDDAFDRDSIYLLTQNYIGSASAIISAYSSELVGARAKN